jgi:hypothetical protein
VQSISGSIEAICRKTLQDGNLFLRQDQHPKISVKNYMLSEIDTCSLQGLVQGPGFKSGSGALIAWLNLLVVISADVLD